VATHDRSARPDEAPRPTGRLTQALASKTLLAFAASAGVVALLFVAQDGGDFAPPVSLLIVAAFVISLCTAGALAVALRWDLSLPVQVIGYAVAYNVLVVAVKFALGPAGLYEANQTETLMLPPVPPLNFAPVWVSLIAVATFLLYAAVYVGVYILARRRLSQPGPPEPPVLVAPVARLKRRIGASRWALVGLVVGAIVVAGALGWLALLSGWLFTAAEYLQLVFTAGVSLAVGLALAAATALCAGAFSSVTDRARLVGDATVLVAFFWLGLAFLALYHVLWVVYVLLLITVWPLRTVVPK
jgi:hypothetical protein